MTELPSKANDRLVDLGPDLTVELIAEHIRAAALSDNGNGGVTTSARPTNTLAAAASVSEVTANGRSPDRVDEAHPSPFVPLSERLRDMSLNLQIFDEWLRAETEWNAEAQERVHARLDELSARIDDFAERVDLMVSDMSERERRMMQVIHDVEQRVRMSAPEPGSAGISRQVTVNLGRFARLAVLVARLGKGGT